MKLRVALFFAGLFGALATLFILVSFGTDFWLLASETCKDFPEPGHSQHDGFVNQDLLQERPLNVTFHHEGFFWRCMFEEMMEDNNLWKFWFENQPHERFCKPACLLPFPIPDQSYNSTSYQSALIYRCFWSASMLLGVVCVVAAGFTIICAAPFTSHRLYKAGGGLYLMSGFFLLVVTVMYVLWFEVLEVIPLYVDYRRSTRCSGFDLNLTFGLSFMLAPVGVFFCLLAGLLFLVIGRNVHHNFL